MAISTTEVVFVLLLGVGLLVMIWIWYASHSQRSQLSTQAYTRGVNAASPKTVGLACDANSVISIDRATQVCSNPDAKNIERSMLDPMTKTGDFDPNRIADLTSDMGGVCNGKQTCLYTFTGAEPFPNGVACDGTPQLIGTYTCVAAP